MRRDSSSNPTRWRTVVENFFCTSPETSRASFATRGSMTLPPLAIAAYTTAICSGVVETSPWPMEKLTASPPRYW